MSIKNFFNAKKHYIDELHSAVVYEDGTGYSAAERLLAADAYDRGYADAATQFELDQWERETITTKVVNYHGDTIREIQENDNPQSE